MVTVPILKQDFKVLHLEGIQDVDNVYQQYCENDFLTKIYTDKNKSTLLNYKLNDLINLNNTDNTVNNCTILVNSFYKIADFIIKYRLCHLYDVNKILEIINEQ